MNNYKNYNINKIYSGILNSAMKNSNNNYAMAKYIADHVVADIKKSHEISCHSIASGMNNYAHLYIAAKKIGMTPGSIISL